MRCILEEVVAGRALSFLREVVFLLEEGVVVTV